MTVVVLHIVWTLAKNVPLYNYANILKNVKINIARFDWIVEEEAFSSHF